jgi:hypothetical protein
MNAIRSLRVSGILFGLMQDGSHGNAGATACGRPSGVASTPHLPPTHEDLTANYSPARMLRRDRVTMRVLITDRQSAM